MSLIVIVLIVLLLCGYFYYPREGYAAPGYAPISLGGIVLVVVVLWLLGVIHF